MPELPEIEVLKIALAETVVGLDMIKAVFFRTSLRESIPVHAFKKRLLNERVHAVSRRGKYLILNFESGYCALFHLGMSGHLLRLSDETPVFPHTHAIFSFRKSATESEETCPSVHLHYIDPRRFGRIDCVAITNHDHCSYFQKLGPEPLDFDGLAAYFAGKGAGVQRSLKNWLMDGRIIAGIGNIYACEALHLAGIHPAVQPARLTTAEWGALAAAIQKTLEAAILSGVSSVKRKQETERHIGYFSVSLRVYGKAGQLCPSCGYKIEMIRISGRSSFFCPFCQKEK